MHSQVAEDSSTLSCERLRQSNELSWLQPMSLPERQQKENGTNDRETCDSDSLQIVLGFDVKGMLIRLICHWTVHCSKKATLNNVFIHRWLRAGPLINFSIFWALQLSFGFNYCVEFDRKQRATLELHHTTISHRHSSVNLIFAVSFFYRKFTFFLSFFG